MPVPVNIDSGKTELGCFTRYSGHPSHWFGKSLKHKSCLCKATPLYIFADYVIKVLLSAACQKQRFNLPYLVNCAV